MKKKMYRGIGTIFLLLLLIVGASIFYTSDFDVKASSGTTYLIKVNRKMCTATVYKKDSSGKYTVPVKAMLCSTGYETPLGTYQTKAKYRWKILMGNVWGQYSTRIVDGVLFHSVWYYDKDPATVSNKQFNNLGTICSHGCVRLSTADAKWIYDNCAVGTTVTIYDSSNPGPLGKPEGVKVSTSSLMGYDPTDIWSSGNTYKNKKPTISGVSGKTYKYGATTTSLTKGISVKSSTGVSMSASAVKVTIKLNSKTVSKINTKTAGSYKVTYTVTDALDRTASKTVTVTVKMSTEKPKLTGVKNQLVANGTKVNRTFAIKNVKATWNGVTLAKSKIKTKITKKSNVYTIQYTVTADNKKSVTKTATITVDNKAPVFSGVSDREIAWDDAVTKTIVMKGVTASDNYTTIKKSDISVTIKKASSTVYKITYKVSDDYKNTATKTVRWKITNFLKFVVPDTLEIPSNVEMNADYVMNSGIKAYNNAKDITDSMTVTYSKTSAGNYKVVLIIEDSAGHKRTQTVTFKVAEATEDTKEDSAADSSQETDAVTQDSTQETTE